MTHSLPKNIQQKKQTSTYVCDVVGFSTQMLKNDYSEGRGIPGHTRQYTALQEYGQWRSKNTDVKKNYRNRINHSIDERQLVN